VVFLTFFRQKQIGLDLGHDVLFSLFSYPRLEGCMKILGGQNWRCPNKYLKGLQDSISSTKQGRPLRMAWALDFDRSPCMLFGHHFFAGIQLWFHHRQTFFTCFNIIPINFTYEIVSGCFVNLPSFRYVSWS
jgi:hypothetical protein